MGVVKVVLVVAAVVVVVVVVAVAVVFVVIGAVVARRGAARRVGATARASPRWCWQLRLVFGLAALGAGAHVRIAASSASALPTWRRQLSCCQAYRSTSVRAAPSIPCARDRT